MINNNIITLEQYRDKSFLMSILCQLLSEYYSKIKNIISIPLILSSTILTILNASDINNIPIKYTNVAFNSITALLLAFSNNFKIAEKGVLFRELAIKFNKLCHKIEDLLVYSINDISHDEIKGIIYEYDTLNESLIYTIPNFIKMKIKNNYTGKRTLPNLVNCETSFSSHRLVEENLKSSIVVNEPKVLSVKPFVEVVEC